MKTLIYLAVPYSHPDPKVREARFRAANKYAAMLMREGLHVFSPISHTHPIAECGDLPKGWDFWKEYDTAILSICKEIRVLQLEGWQESVGVRAEMKLAHEMQILFKLVCPIVIEEANPEKYPKCLTTVMETGPIPDGLGFTPEPSPTDPKGEVGKTKPQLHLIPRVAMEAMAGALQQGKERYGERNWVQNRVCQSTYLSAILRHTMAIVDGQDIDPDSGVTHLGHILAGCAILLDAGKAGTLVDDRVKPTGLT